MKLKNKVFALPDQNKLKMIFKQPNYPVGFATPRTTKKLSDLRGPETVHNKLIHRQYGIIALCGGNMTYGHFEMIRSTVLRKLDTSQVFSVWRVDSPWKPITRHGQGKKLGGGKGAISHYVTPVKRGRVIIEIGGSISMDFMHRVLIDIAQKLPFPAKVVSQADLDNIEKENEEIRTKNLNTLRWEWCIKNNMLNVLNYSGKYDIEFSHMGPNCR